MSARVLAGALGRRWAVGRRTRDADHGAEDGNENCGENALHAARMAQHSANRKRTRCSFRAWTFCGEATAGTEAKSLDDETF